MAHTDRAASPRRSRALRAVGRARNRGGGRRPPETGRARLLRGVPFLAGVAVLVLGLGAGTAYAYFGATGSGTGSGSVGTLQPLVVEHATAATTGRLFPAGTGTLVVEVTNPNAFAVRIVGITQAGPVTVTGGGAACTSATTATPGSSGVSVAPTLASGLSLAVTAGPATTTTFTISAGAAMSAASNTTCQGATFRIPVAVAVQSP